MWWKVQPGGQSFLLLFLLLVNLNRSATQSTPMPCSYGLLRMLDCKLRQFRASQDGNLRPFKAGPPNPIFQDLLFYLLSFRHLQKTITTGIPCIPPQHTFQPTSFSSWLLLILLQLKDILGSQAPFFLNFIISSPFKRYFIFTKANIIFFTIESHTILVHGRCSNSEFINKTNHNENSQPAWKTQLGKIFTIFTFLLREKNTHMESFKKDQNVD